LDNGSFFSLFLFNYSFLVYHFFIKLSNSLSLWRLRLFINFSSSICLFISSLFLQEFEGTRRCVSLIFLYNITLESLNNRYNYCFPLFVTPCNKTTHFITLSLTQSHNLSARTLEIVVQIPELKQLKTSITFEHIFFLHMFVRRRTVLSRALTTYLWRNDGTSFQESALMRELKEYLFQSSLTKAVLFYVQFELGCKQKFFFKKLRNFPSRSIYNKIEVLNF